jgi:hypothetical protein
MENQNDLHKIGIFVAPMTLVLGIIIALIFQFSLTKLNNINQIWMVSMFLGLFTGLMNFSFLLRGSRPSYTDSYTGKNNLMKRSMLYFFFRIITFGAIFSIVAMNQFTKENPSFNLIPTAIGYFLHLVIFLVVYIIFNLRRKKENN